MRILSKIIGQTYNLAKKSKPQATEIIKENGLRTVLERNLESVENPELKLLLGKSYNTLTNRATQVETKRFTSIIDDIIHKLDLCEDTKIKEKAHELLKTTEGKNRFEVFETVTKAEQMLDAVNVTKGKYCVIKKSTMFTKPDIDTEVRKSNKVLYEKLGNELDDFTKFSGMREYIERFPEETNIGKYLWNKYFLPQVKHFKGKEDGQSVINKLKDIEQKFGTIIFIDSKELGTNEMLKFVKKEFELQKKYSKGKAKITPHLHVSEYDWGFIDDDCAAFCMGRKYIKINGIYNISSLRHESEHFLDDNIITHTEKTLQQQNFLQRVIFFPISTVKAYKKFFESLKKFIDKKKLAIKENKEMKNAGIPRGARKYARTNDRDRRAVFVEGNMEAYSDEIKKRMIDDGVPEFMTLMPQHSNNYIYKVLKHKHRDNPEAKQVIDKLNKVLNGNLCTIDNNNYVIFKDELKHYKDGETTSLDMFFAKFTIRQYIPRKIKKFCNKFKKLFSKKEAV